MNKNNLYIFLTLFMGLNSPHNSYCAAASPADQAVLLDLQEKEQQKKKEKELSKEHNVVMTLEERAKLAQAILADDIKAVERIVRKGESLQSVWYDVRVTLNDDLRKKAPAYFQSQDSVQVPVILLALELQRYAIMNILIDRVKDLWRHMGYFLSQVLLNIQKAPGKPFEYEEYVNSIVNWLIIRGFADVNWTDGNTSLLSYAAKNDLPMVVSTLLKAGQDYDFKAAKKISLQAVEATARSMKDYSPAVQEVLQDYLNYELIRAIYANNNELAMILVKAGANPMQRARISSTSMQALAPAYFYTHHDVSECTTATLAAILHRFTILENMLANGLNINALDINGNSLLVGVLVGIPRYKPLPLEHDQEEYINVIVKWLIAHGADVNWRSKDNTLLTLAGKMNLPLIVKTLLQAGANPDLEPAMPVGIAMQGAKAAAAQPVSRSFRSSISNYSPAVQEVWHNYRAAHRAKVREAFKGEGSQPILPHELVDEIHKY